jgi:hypothetical protein
MRYYWPETDEIEKLWLSTVLLSPKQTTYIAPVDLTFLTRALLLHPSFSFAY